MASVKCEITKTGKPVFSAAWVVVGKRAIDLTNSQKFPVPLDAGEYDLLWETKGEIGEGIAIKVSVNGAIVATLGEQIITRFNRAGSGSRPTAAGYNPLRFKV